MKKKDLIEQLVSEIETGGIRTLGIYGHGASGKSTFAQELYQALDSTTVNLLETDPYITSERHLVIPKQAPDQKVTAVSQWRINWQVCREIFSPCRQAWMS